MAGPQKWLKHTLHPKWEDSKYCLVQEPKTQDLHVELSDHDAINLKVLSRQLSDPAQFCSSEQGPYGTFSMAPDGADHTPACLASCKLTQT